MSKGNKLLQTKTITIPVFSSNEVFDAPDYFRGTLNANDIRYIKRCVTILLREAPQVEAQFRNAPYKIVSFHFPSEYNFYMDNGEGEDWNEWEGRVEIVTLNVTQQGFYWSGYYKHTDIRWETEEVPLEEIYHGIVPYISESIHIRRKQ